jgi:nitrogen fixation protein FixH
MTKPFTGRHMSIIMIGGFGIVIAVNLVMASFAIGGFSGTVVKNSYVASQNYNGWLDRANAQDALGWDVAVSRDARGMVLVTVQNVPEDVELSAIVRRPLGVDDRRKVTFTGSPAAGFQSVEPLPGGRWLIRLAVTSGKDQWRGESELP